MFRALAVAVGVTAALVVPSARVANGTVEVHSCTEAAFDAALLQGGLVTFACDGVLPITTTKHVPAGRFVALDGHGHDVTLDGGGVVQLFVVAPGGALHLNSLTLIRGRAMQGGAIRNEGALRVTDSAFTGHLSFDRGGAIGSFGPGASLSIEGCHFENNRGFGGGAVANGSFLGLRGDMTVIRSAFVGNTAQFAGALLTGGDAVEISDSEFRENSSSQQGGAIVNARNLGILRSTFIANTAGSSGGAIENGASGLLRVEHSTFGSQAASGAGGAINNLGVAHVSHSSFWSNSASAGGAIGGFGQPGVGSALLIDQSRFTANVATGPGGALSLLGSLSATLSLLQFDGNSANLGGAVAALPFLGSPTVGVLHTGFRHNKATTQGGALFTAAPTVLRFAQAIDNEAASGGGVFTMSALFLEHVLVAKNIGGDCAEAAGGSISDAGHNVVLDGSCGL